MCANGIYVEVVYNSAEIANDELFLSRQPARGKRNRIMDYMVRKRQNKKIRPVQDVKINIEI